MLITAAAAIAAPTAGNHSDERCRSRAERQMMQRLSLRQLGAAVGVDIQRSDEDRVGFEKSFDEKLWRFERHFVSPTAFRAYVRRKLDQAAERTLVQRIAAIFVTPEDYP